MNTNARVSILFLALVIVPASSSVAGGFGSIHFGHHHHSFSHRSHHSGVRLHLGHIGRLSFGHHSSHVSHHSYGNHFGSHYSSFFYPSYSYRSHYPSYRYSSPSYYSYRSYGRSYGVSSYNYPSCLSYRIVAPRVIQPRSTAPAPNAEQIYEKPKIDPPPESLPLPPTPRAAPAPQPTTTTSLHFAVLRSQQTPTVSAERPQPLNGPTDQLGPQLRVPRARTLVSDEETPWIAE